jgi:hypothetical protein
MSYQGNIPASNFESPKKDRFTGISGTTCSLTYAVSSVADIIVWVNSVKQDFTNYSVSGNTLTLGGTLVSADIVEVTYVGRTYQSVNPSASSVGTSQLADDAVTAAKLSSTAVDNTNTNSTLITAQTEKSTLVDADKFLLSDSAASGALKYVQKSNLPSGTHVRVGGSSGSGDVADITYDNILSNDYYTYRIIGMMETTADAYMEILLRIGSSGSNGNASGQYRQTWNGWASSSTDSYLVNAGDWGSNSIKPMSASRTNDGDDDHGVFFDMILYTRYLNKTYWRINSQMLNNDKSRIYGYENVGWQSATGAITGFNFYFNTGSIDNHRIDIYGVQSG